MKRIRIQSRTLAMSALLIPLVALFLYVALRSGPMAAVPVTLTTVEFRAITPALFGIGTVEARYSYPIGPTAPGRVLRVEVDVGDRVVAGQLLAEMDPIDLDDRAKALGSTLKRAGADLAAAEARLRDAMARLSHAESEATRYQQLLEANTASEETLAAKQQELDVAVEVRSSAHANMEAARHQHASIRSDLDALLKQRVHLRLLAPVNGWVVSRHAEAGATVMAGQSVIDMVDPDTLWINTRFEQLSAAGLAPDLTARIVLRSESGREVAGKVQRVEPLADSVTEELLAKVAFASIPVPPPAMGELAEVTVTLPGLPSAPTLPNACIHRVNGTLGVWKPANGSVRFTSVKTGARDLDGRVQILDGLETGDRVVLFSRSMLGQRTRITIVDQLEGSR